MLSRSSVTNKYRFSTLESHPSGKRFRDFPYPNNKFGPFPNTNSKMEVKPISNCTCFFSDGILGEKMVWQYSEMFG